VFLSALELFVSRRAEQGMAVRGYRENFASWISKLLPAGDRIRVLYWYDDHTVRMIDAWIVPGATNDPYS